MQMESSSASNRAVSASLVASFTSRLIKIITFYSVLMVFRSIMAFHTTETVVKIDMVRNEMGERQIQVSGLDFKFWIAAPKHRNHNKELKKSRQLLSSADDVPQPHLQQSLGPQYVGFEMVLKEVSGVLPLERKGSQRCLTQMTWFYKLPKELWVLRKLRFKSAAEACSWAVMASTRRPFRRKRRGKHESMRLRLSVAFLAPFCPWPTTPGTLLPNETTRRRRTGPVLPAFLSRENSVRQVLNKESLKFARTVKNNTKIKCSYPLTL